MTENAPEPTTEAPARPTRVPNVSPGAVSGLDHEVIGSAAQEAHDAQHGEAPQPDEQAPAEEPTTSPGPDTEPIEVPEGSDEDRVAWVAAGEDQQARSARADAVYTHAKDAGDDQDTLDALGGLLRDAVYGEGSHETPADPATGPELHSTDNPDA